MKLSSFQVGEGPRAVVLLHGFLGSGRNLRSLATRWAQVDPSRRLLLPDLTGHGASPPPPQGATLATVAADVLETAEAHGLRGPLELVGHSLGGRVGLAAARLAPERVRAVTLLDIAPGPLEPPLTSATGRLLEALREAPASVPSRAAMRSVLLGRGLSPALTDWLLMNLAPLPGGEGGLGWRVDREALAALHERANAEDLWGVIGQPGLEVRCIRGARSPFVTDADARRLRAAGCEVETLEAGHYVHVDALEALVGLLVARG